MPTINIQNIGSAASATATGKPMHHATIAAFATWIRTRDLVTNDEQIVGHVYDNYSITADIGLYVAPYSANHFVTLMPAPGFGVNELDKTGALDYGTVGIELTFTTGALHISHGVSVEGFRQRCNNASTQYPSVNLARWSNNSTYPNGVFDARMRKNRILALGGFAAVSSNLNLTQAVFDDNYVFNESAGAGVGYVPGGAKINRSMFVGRGAGAGRTILGSPASNYNVSTLTDCVFVGAGAVPVDRTRAPVLVNCFTGQAVTGDATGYTVSANLITSTTDVRPKAGGALIGTGSAASKNTYDIRGGYRGAAPDVGPAMLQAAATPVKSNATVTGVVVNGQRVIVTGTYTSTPESGTAYLNPDSPANGAVAKTTTVVLDNGNFTATFYNVTPGNYLAPSVLMTNLSGTGTSSGGTKAVVAIPPVPIVKITNQVRSGTTITLEGKILNQPTSATVTMSASATPNGAVTRGPVGLPVSEDGSFSIILSTLTPGSYDAPVVSATNFSGTITATGDKYGRIYANGTQPVGAEPVVIPPAYSVPAFTASVVAVGGTVTDVTFVNTSTAAKTNVPFTFGQAFKKGDIAPTNFLVGKIAGAADVPLQFNVKATHPDGSVRHAIISGVLPTLSASQERVMSLVRAASSTATTTAAGSASVISAGFTAAITLAIGGVVYTASPNAALAAGVAAKDTWLGGSIATDWVINVPFTNPSNVAHPTMTAQFSVRHYPGAASAKVDAVVEDSHPFNSIAEITFDLDMKIGGVSRYARPGVVGHPGGRFKRTLWWGAEPTLHIKHNSAYLTASKQVSNYDLTVQMSAALLGDWAAALQGDAFEPYKFGILTQSMATTGGRPDIGPLPNFGAATVISMDKRAKDITLAHADVAAGAWGIHARDVSGGPGSGRPLSLIYFPYATRAGTTNDSKNTATGVFEKLNSPGYGADTAHQPSMAFLPYLLTGDFYYLEELHFWANFNLTGLNPAYRNYHHGLVKGEQVRGQGWCLRTMATTAAITPDAHPDKSAFAYWLGKNIGYYNNEYTDNPVEDNPFHFVNSGGYVIQYPLTGTNPRIGIGPWQDDFFTTGVGMASELGFPEATRLLKWKGKFQVDRMIAPGYCWIHGGIYVLNVRPTQNDPLYKTMAQSLAASIDPQINALPCNSPERLAKMNALRTLPSDPYVLGEMTGYAYGTQGYPSILQTALAYVADTDYPDADLAWDLLDSRSVKPNYGDGPQFAIGPRAFIAPETPPPALIMDSYSGTAGQTIFFGRSA